jgi:hypothetical protein
MVPIALDVTTITGYRVSSALRGPDWDDPVMEKLKRLLTGRLRYIVDVRHPFVVTRTHPTNLGPSFIEEYIEFLLAERQIEIKNAIVHYLNHLDEAFEALAIHIEEENPVLATEMGILRDFCFFSVQTLRYQGNHQRDSLSKTWEALLAYEKTHFWRPHENNR